MVSRFMLGQETCEITLLFLGLALMVRNMVNLTILIQSQCLLITGTTNKLYYTISTHYSILFRVPQALYQLGLLSYSPELIKRLENREYFPSGSEDEIEIRGNSIWAVELVRERIERIDPQLKINAILIDFYIWDMAKEIQDKMTVPTHCTRSCFY